MKTLIFSASPKSEGWTNKLLSLVLREIDDYKIYYPYKMNIKPCIDCSYCRKNPCCFINDDIKCLYEDIKAAKYIIIASPVYFGGFPAPMKMIIDRCQNFYFNSIPLEKKVFLLAACGRKRGDMERAMMLETEIFMKAINGSLVSSITARDTDSNRFDVDYNKIREITDTLNYT